MSKFYNKLENDFTQIPNTILQDIRISALAFKIYCYICFRIGRNSEWEFYNNEILKYCKEGKHSLIKAKKELIEFGYLEKIKQNIKEDGTFGGCDYIIHKEPLTNNISPTTEIPSTVSPTTEIPSTVKHITNNKDIEINKEFKKNESNKEKYKKEKENLNELIENDLRFTEEDKEQIKIFIQDRKERKKPITERGLSILLNELQDLMNRGYKMKYCIDRAIQSNWTGIKSEWFKDNNTNQKSITQPVDYNFSGKDFINSIAEDNI